MFEIKIKEELDKLTPRNNVIKKLDKIPIKSELYLEFISKYKSEELSPDIHLLDYEKVLNKNSYIKKNYSQLSEIFWLIADSGQGDEWFLSLKDNKVFFYDHNKGEYIEEGFIEMNLSFEDFFKLGLIVNELENYLIEEVDEDIVKKPFINTLNNISPNLYNKYPYKYF